MPLFGKRIESIAVKVEPKAQATCCPDRADCCGGKRDSRFLVLGACCSKSQKTFENVKQAVKEMGLEEEVLNIGDAVEIAAYGVMQTPALVVDGKVASSGRFLKVEEVKELLVKLGVK